MRSPRLLPILLLAACSPLVDDASLSPPQTAVVQAEKKPAAPTVASVPITQAEPPDASPTHELRYLRTRVGDISLEAVVFDARRHRLVVADQAGGPASRWSDARQAGQAMNGLAAVNGGFFTPEGKPLGQLVAAGKSTGSVNRSTSLGAGWFVEKNGRPSLVRRGSFQGGTEALQAGPFLVENSLPVGGLSDKPSSARTFLATDGGSGWVIARSGACSLAQLGKALAGTSIGGVKIRRALNLDGGRSSEIWVASSVPGGPAFTRPLWNKPVRNFLVLRAR
ncbi:phosphodiester glycosidase family protein [Haloferula sargassicola]|uniref:Phosphodiester glycosidase domain-containing protein n=1 Tax=Haloferula sargassicola TaxID=490096 RepID=A0ABP9UI57_9BACT